MKFECYLSDSGSNPFVDYARDTSGQQDRLQMTTFDPFVVDIVKHDNKRVQAFIYYRGKLVAHSASHE